jgi:amino-acid N-acetyltransferase
VTGCRPTCKRYLPCAVRSSRAGVGRVHLIGYDEDGTLLRELFTHDGVGTVITRESLEQLRDARTLTTSAAWSR